MKKLSKIILVIGLVLLVIGLVFLIQEDSSNKDSDKDKDKTKDPVIDNIEDKKLEEIQTEDVTKDEINELVDSLLHPEVTKDKLEELVGSDITSSLIYYGKDSYIRNLGSDLKGVDDYHKKRDQYAEQLEKLIKDNFNVEIKEYIVSAEGDIIQKISYRTYYNAYFMDDFSAVYTRLLSYTDINLEDVAMREPTNDELIKMYKIQIKALELMSNYFNDYINENETIDYDLIYKKNGQSITNDYFSLLVNLYGKMYNNANFSSDGRSQRVAKIINDAISSGELDINDPYKLK